MTPPGLYKVSKMRSIGRNTAGLSDVGDSAVTLSTQDEGQEAGYVIFVYNLLDREHVVNAPPKFPAFRIPACPKGEKFSFTVLPAFTKEVFNHPGTTEFYYKKVDGRKDATTLLNPSAFPGIQWEAQLASWESLGQENNNLNSRGVFWSLTSPDDLEKLEEEIKIFREYATRTMDGLVKEAALLAAQNKPAEITPWMHFAMDYLGKQAIWHTTTDHMISCPNCGDVVKDGIAYHRNSFGDKCILDYARCVKLGIIKPEDLAKPETQQEVPQKKSGRKQSAA